MSDIKHNSTDPQNDIESTEISNFHNSSILKVGFIEIKKGSGDWKTFYGIISGGSLFWYKNITDENPVGSVPSLRNYTSFEIDNCKKEFVFGLTNDPSMNSKNIIYIGCSSLLEYKRWHSCIIETLGKDPAPAPKRSFKKRKIGIGERAKKKVTGFVGTGIGKSLIKSTLNDQIMGLISSIKKIVSRDSKKRAQEIERDILTIIAKCYILINDNELKIESFHDIDDPVRKALDIMCKCFNYRNRMSSDLLEIAFLKVETYLKEVEKILLFILQSHLSTTNMFRLSSMFGYFASIKFLRRVYSDEEIQEDLQMFLDAMEFYTQFHFE